MRTQAELAERLRVGLLPIFGATTVPTFPDRALLAYASIMRTVFARCGRPSAPSADFITSVSAISL